MASKTGIALLSMYDDEDDEMEDLNEEQEQEEQEEQEERGADEDMDDIKQGFPASVASPPVVEDNSTPEATKFVSQINSSSLIVQRKSRRGTVTIVDYGHDEVAMSPEAEEGEIVSADGELQTANGNSQEETPGTVRVLSPSTQATSQSSEQLDISLNVTMNLTARESETAEVEDGHKIAEEALKDVDPLDTFLPSPPEERCSDELQDRINKFLALKRAGKSFNAEVRNKKDYRNPDFLLHAVRYQDIDQIGSCFSKDVFDPHGYDKSDYYDELEADVKREAERKEQERKKSQKVEFYAGGTQPGTVITAPKIGMPTPGVSTGGAGGFHSVPTAADAAARDGRQNKKSKWDKVDGDQRNSLPSGGKDSVSNVGAHAAILSAANAGAGAGYPAFAQQRRREAEEKRSSERRRS